MSHSKIVGGSTAKRVMACPGSVTLSQKVPDRPASAYAEEGTRLHALIAQILETDAPPPVDEPKIADALLALESVDPKGEMDFAVEKTVSFGDFIPDVFGSVDMIGRVGDHAVVLDWKFGDGVIVDAEENEQLMFYAAAAMRTPGLEWVFDGAQHVQLVIVQPPEMRAWTTSIDRIKRFELALASAVRVALGPNPPLETGDHCRWCPAKAICPQMTGAVDRARRSSLQAVSGETLAQYLVMADQAEAWAKDVRALAFEVLSEGLPVPGWKLVPKRALRQWVDVDKAADWLANQGVNPYPAVIVSPAQAEKLLGKKTPLADGLAVSVSSGNTLAPEDDPRPAVMQIGTQLKRALSKVQ